MVPALIDTLRGGFRTSAGLDPARLWFQPLVSLSGPGAGLLPRGNRSVLTGWWSAGKEGVPSQRPTSLQDSNSPRNAIHPLFWKETMPWGMSIPLIRRKGPLALRPGFTDASFLFTPPWPWRMWTCPLSRRPFPKCPPSLPSCGSPFSHSR